MALSVGNVTEDTGFTGGSSRSISHDHNGTLIIAGQGGFDEWDGISGVTWDGAAMSPLLHIDDGSIPSHDNNFISWWGLASSNTGTHNVVFSYSPDSTNGGNFVVISISGQATPFLGNTAGNYNSLEASPLSIAITMTAGSIAFDLVCASGVVATPGAGQTQTCNAAFGGERVYGSYKLNATAMEWTYAGSIRRSAGVIEIKAAVATPTLGGSLALLGVGR